MDRGKSELVVPRGDVTSSPRSSQQLIRRADVIGLLMRHGVLLVAAAVGLTDPASSASSTGRVLLAALAVWSALRLRTRSTGHLATGIDFAAVIAACLSIPQLLSDPGFPAYNTVPQVIAGTAVVSFSVVLPAEVSLPMTALIATAYAWGAAGLMGWAQVGGVLALYYFFLQWATAAAIRLMLLRAAAAVDAARRVRQTAELRQEVSAAVREFDREQLALLHDTAASTLLMVGDGAAIPAARLAAQAGRDLELLDRSWATDDLSPIDLVSALRAEATLLSTPTRVLGPDNVWCDARIGHAVIGAAREAMNNADRHARAGTLSITVDVGRVMLVDDGVGFDSNAVVVGHGLRESIGVRTRRVGVTSSVTSEPGQGTVVELTWATTPALPAESPSPDSEELITQTRRRYRIAMTVYALANLVIAGVPVWDLVPHPTIEVILMVAAGVCVLIGGSTRIHNGASRLAVIAVLFVIAALQPSMLSTESVGGHLNWTQNTVGWCSFPTLLTLPIRTGSAILVALWSVGAVAEFVRYPSAATLVNIGLGTASILSVQLFALWFNHLLRDAATDAAREAGAAHRLTARFRIDQALHGEYARRYATLVDSIVPLLQQIHATGIVDGVTQRRARSQSRRLRTLFDQAASFDHPVVRALRPLIDDAEDRRVDAVFEVSGPLPESLDTDVLAPLVDAVERALSAATTAARVVVSAHGTVLSVSILCSDIPDADQLEPPSDREGIETDMVTSDNAVWFLIQFELPQEGPGCAQSIGGFASFDGGDR